MHHSIRMESLERRSNLRERLQISFDKFRARIDRHAMAFGKIVEDGDCVSLIEKQLGANAADVAGAADDENLHRASCGAPPRRVKTNKCGRGLCSPTSASGFLLEHRDHPPDQLIFSARVENFETLLLRAPLDNVDVDMAHAPLPHGDAAGFVKV